MNRMLRKTWPWAVGLAAFYLAQYAVNLANNLGIMDDLLATSWVLTFLVGINPAATFLVAGLVGYRHGFAWLLAPLAVVAWLPATFLVYNDSALVYCLFYLPFTLAGLGLGVLLRARRTPRPA